MSTFEDFKSFIVGNNILTTMAAVTIGFSTGTMIRSFVGDILLPSVYAVFVNRISTLQGAFAPISTLNLDNFVKELITWIMVIVFTYLIIDYVFRRMVLKVPNKNPAPSPSAGPSMSVSPALAPAPKAAPSPSKKNNDASSTVAGGEGTENFSPVEYFTQPNMESFFYV